MTTLPAYYATRPGPLHALLLAGSVPLFLGALLSDVAYGQTYQIQWANFASWLIAGALVFSGFALLFALVNLLRARRKSGRPAAYFLLLLAAWVLGLVNAFQHAKDAYAMMPAGLVLSVIVTLLALVAAWIGLSDLRSGDAK
ncbi:hypothetical protein Q1J68_28905 [Pseudomonas pergaminensis]|jgi:uncharacterized membrane protein|uniref:DUF2231 domain-containing protein n=1 Tax=Pseudomonas pergaminensis TaxID=2853159 RepID=A0ABD7TB19_9PSED|nr:MULTISPECIES: DUF2231 domain-containing protein [Pseudomonas]PIB50567.1 hypothetical protein AOA57_09130 [Pseudomonas sp. 2588-5]PJK32704.1 hypothetical protein CWC49_05115 [Pseudomonas sp. S09F 262]PJK42194.1 hypothetical protein CWC48_24665 [Pseudomonas sp. S10E 269]USV98645.1 hypothetical protein KUA23_16345 [Pseudomonas pergaminensis]